MGKYFGTDGFRGEANIDLTVEHAYKVGRFLGWYFGKDHKAQIVIGKDTRRSSYMFEYSLVAGLTASGADAYLLHVTTTPSVSYVVRTENFDCGIMISASHNPFYDNGIKVINGLGQKLEADIEAQIEAERAALEADLAEIRTRAYPRAVRYDTPRVQSSPDPDGNMVKIAAAIERRTARTKRAVEALEERQRQIDNVHEIVLAMDAKAKIVLLTMYYPRRTYEQAAEALGMDVSTVSRQRKTAVERLVRKYIRLHGAIE